MFERHQRIQRREFKDYQPLFMLINSLDIIDEATRRDFICMQGPVWRRYNEATKGAQHRRITVLFIGDQYNSFEELLLVGCDFVRRRQHCCKPLWTGHPWTASLDDAAVRHLCIGLAGRSVLMPDVLGRSAHEPLVADETTLLGSRHAPAPRTDEHALPFNPSHTGAAPCHCP
jgi:hypothetical protein